MTATENRESSGATAMGAAETMAKYGIKRVPVDYFYYKAFRYTNLDDAIAEARRQNPTG
jgi:hypothetical protein